MKFFRFQTVGKNPFDQPFYLVGPVVFDCLRLKGLKLLNLRIIMVEGFHPLLIRNWFKTRLPKGSSFPDLNFQQGNPILPHQPVYWASFSHYTATPFLYMRLIITT